MSDLQTLFSTDPLTYTKEKGELAAIVSEMRANRKRFLMGNVKAGSTKPQTEKQKVVASLTSKLELDL